jgi:nucleotide-binding universal stress UspA family protein
MKVLLAVDDSKFSDAALQAVIAQIPPQGTEVLVLHVVEPITLSSPPQMSPSYTPELETRVKEGHELVEREVVKLRAAGFKTCGAVETGDIRGKILDAAAKSRAYLIVLGSHGRKGVQRFLLGSVAENVARHAPCSVQIVRILTQHGPVI